MTEQAMTNRDTQADGFPSLASLLWTFLKIGSTAFGGFMALISVVQNYAVERRKLLTHDDMLDGISLATILPGPVAVNVVAYTGYRSRGWQGALVSAFAVILPSFLLLVVLSFLYFRFGQIPAAGRFFTGFIPAVAAVVLAAAWNMSAKAVRGPREAAIALSAAVLLIAVGGFFISVGVIAGSGMLGWFLFRNAAPKGVPAAGSGNERKQVTSSRMVLAAPAAPLLGLHLGAASSLFLTFAGMSLLLFGGGYVFIPLIQHTVVETNGWLTQREFVDAIALGQVTPGPILISAAFIGFKVGGLVGAAAATIGIFTPPAIVMLICARFLDRIKASRAVTAALRGIRPAVVGMIAAAGVVIARSAPHEILSVLIFAVSLVALVRYKVQTAWIIPLAGVAGLLFA